MTQHRFTAETARRYGSLGGKASARRRMTIGRLEGELGDLATPADAQRWLRYAYLWSAAGQISGTASNSMVKSIDVWLRCREAEHSFEAVDGLKRTIQDLTAERDRLAGDVEALELQLARTRRAS